MRKKDGKCIIIKVFLIIVCTVAVVGRLYGENTFFSELSYGYNTNVKETKDKENSFFNKYTLLDEYVFRKIPLTFSVYSEVNLFYSSGLSNNYTLDSSLSYKIGNFNLSIGSYLFSDKNELQNSFNGVYSSLEYKIKNFGISYSLMRKYFTAKYQYGNYKDFFYSISNMKTLMIKNKGKMKNFKNFLLQSLSSKHEKDYMHTLNFEYRLEHFSFSPMIVINRSNISYEEYICPAADLEFYWNRNRFSLNFLFSPSYVKYSELGRKDLLIDTKINLLYYFSTLLYCGFEVEYKQNNSNLQDEDFEKFTTSITVGINF